MSLQNSKIKIKQTGINSTLKLIRKCLMSIYLDILGFFLNLYTNQFTLFSIFLIWIWFKIQIFVFRVHYNLYRTKKMGFLSNIQKLIKFADFFYSAQMLRYDDEIQYRTLTGGIVSLAIIVTTFFGFASMLIDTLNLTSITASQQVVKNTNPTFSVLSTEPGSNFMFAVQIWYVNTTGSTRYFDITFQQQIRSGLVVYNQTYLQLVPCTQQHWSFIPQVSQKYDHLGISNWWCPPIGQNYEIYGKYSSNILSDYWISVADCQNQTDPSRPCAPQQEIDQLFSNNSYSFYFTLYYTNPIINSDHKDCVSYYLEDQNYVIFGDQVGAQVYVYFADYTINTDLSIQPFQDIVSEGGVLVQAKSINYPFQRQSGDYARIYIAKSTDSITYTRYVQKISSVFSFIGGMMSAISALLFFVKVYTNHSFEIQIALSVFKPEGGSSSQIKNISINFFTFVKYHVFEVCKMVGITAEWPREKYISDCQNQISKQLSVQSLIKRIIFIEYCLTYLFQDYQLGGLQMETPTSPHQIRAIRQKCQYIFDPAQQNNLSVKNKENSLQNPNNFQISNNFSHQVSASPLQNSYESRNINRSKIVVEDIISDKLNSQISDKMSIKAHIKKERKRNSIFNDYSKNKKVKANLLVLWENANAGNPMSKKIWQLLSNHTKKIITNKQCNNTSEDSSKIQNTQYL